jgi:hypothetical protein
MPNTPVVATGPLFFPVAPLFLLTHGKDITIPKGTEVPTFINGNFALDMAKFMPLEDRSVRLYSIRTKQGSVPFESTLANEISL